ncbi:HNH endonuclease signature motif containing protein [Aestuariimicrobium kwangyangense]|uniref:HNH endonuclease signature motif containing protein n=1 Tax=Aestuariimicrobium kwangyangense TaxID=396389 RepID=UPI0003B77F70|nr:HNH endonuclease signature motif containing protein [Aestuariimicrobium kwangyangense]
MGMATDDELTDQMLRGILDEAVVASNRRRRAEADELVHALHFAEACASRRKGDEDRERRTRLASDGTPEVPEFCHLEYAARLGMRPESGFSVIAIALDLHHRFPEVWDLVHRLSMPVWVAKKVAHATTELPLDQARRLSATLPAEWRRLSPTAFIEHVKACVLMLQAPREVAAGDQELASRGVAFVQNQHTTELHARLSKADAAFLDAQLNRLATELGRAGDTSSRAVRLSKSLGLLATPARALQILQGAIADETDVLPSGLETEEQRECPSTGFRGHLCGQVTVDPDRLLPTMELVVHIAQDALTSGDSAVARTSHFGPQSAATVRQWLGHGRVTVRPVLDTASVLPSSAYEVPGRMRELLDLRNPTSVFPHSTRRSRRLDQDHTVPYSTSGPAGQTRPDNLGPLTRREHRAKTLGGWRVTQTSPGVFEWESPLGYRYMRTPDHTSMVKDPDAQSWVERMLVALLRT